MRRAVPRPRTVVAVLLAVSALVVTGCGGVFGRDRTLTVFAAASLTGVFGELERHFENLYPDLDVRLNVGGSARLAQQIVEGAPADVFASADARTVRRVAAAGMLAGPPETFATNTLAVAVPPGNPEGIDGLADLSRPGVRTVVCAPSVPCGAATRRVADAAGIGLRPVSEEDDVRSVLTKVESGVADAGVVYETDVAASPEVDRVPLPQARGEPNTYSVAVVAGAEDPSLARAFGDYVLGDVSRRTLTEAGFGLP